MDYYTSRVVAEIDMEAIKHNYHQIRKNVSKDTEIMPVVKADAYGHGSTEIARLLQNEGAKRFAVAIVKEGAELRQAGITSPILVLGYTPSADIEGLICNDLTPTVFSYEMAKEIAAIAQKLNKVVHIHIKVDTGMGRIGFLPTQQSLKEIIKIAELKYLKIEGIFTHFAAADEQDDTYTKQQWNTFINFVNDLRKAGILIPIVHAANSAAIINHEYTHCNMVRPGIILYGYYPSDYLQGKKLDLRPAMTLKSQVVHVKELPAGCYISYGRKYCTPKTTKIATIPIGYADGYSRRLTNKGRVLIHGQYAKITGTVCMDQFMVDVSHIENVSAGDEVVLFGRQEGSCISVEEIAEISGTISYEVVCMIGKRVPRVYT